MGALKQRCSVNKSAGVPCVVEWDLRQLQLPPNFIPMLHPNAIMASFSTMTHNIAAAGVYHLQAVPRHSR
jgi:hypothetical protein